MQHSKTQHGLFLAQLLPPFREDLATEVWQNSAVGLYLISIVIQFSVCVEIAIVQDLVSVGSAYDMCDISHFISLFYLYCHSSLSDGSEMS